MDYLRLLLATFVVLLPGRLIARALGQRLVSAAFAWGLAAIFVAWTAVFLFHRSIHLALVVLLVIAIGALAARRFAHAPGSRNEPGSSVWVWAGGIVLGLALWPVEGIVSGDGLFHEARVRKLVDLTNLHLRSVDEFKDGGLHPGYAFPLWHGFLALVSWVSGLDPQTVVRHEPSVLAPIACVVGWEAGVAVFGSRAAGVSVLAAQLALFVFAPGHGGSYATLALPGTAARQLIAPAAIALFFTGNRLGVAAAFGALTLVHPTYALFLVIPLLAYVAIRAPEWRENLQLLAAALVPTGLVLLWLRPIANETLSRNPHGSALANSLQQYKSELVIGNEHHYRLAAEVMGRSGVIAVAALLTLPVTALAIRRRWAAYALGGSVLVLALMLVPWLFVHFSDAVSLSQSRRAAGFAPLPFALAGAAAILMRRWAFVPLALVAGVVLQRLWPGDFDYGLRHGGPAWATWLALIGGAAALVAALIMRPRPPVERHVLGAAAVASLALPVVVHGLAHWSARTKTDPLALSPRLVHNLRTKVPKGAIVIAPLGTSYRVVAVAPVYVVGLPVSHVANTKANQPYVRRKAVLHWVATNDPAVERRYGATWAIRRGRLYRLPQ
jgi:4-amino-4-deoxy-L-arabinose transferase-like glycosyltransferase